LRSAVLTLLFAESALAVVPPPAPPEPAPGASTCTDTFPAGSTRPKVVETFPSRGKSGWALPLEITIVHGKGETVLPGGFGGEGSPEQVKKLEAEGFYLPNAKGSAAPRLDRTDKGEEATSKVTISVVALPAKPGRNELTLPSVPISVARASGEVRTLCTERHTVVVEDPIANTPSAAPRANPKPLRQIEEWTSAKHGAIGALATLVLGALVAWLVSLWRKRPRPVLPPPPPRPPWEVALEELFDVRIAQLVEQGRFVEHVGRVSDTLRKYLGARYGFDGLETTTAEAMTALRRANPGITVLRDVETFLSQADLVKFAKLTPTEGECQEAYGRAEDLVRRTMPAMVPPPAWSVTPGAGDPGAPPAGPTLATPSIEPQRHGTVDAKTGLPAPGPPPPTPPDEDAS
jgi:hypothetical protein